MKERPIIFNSEMVRAILGGRKTQTRRPINPPKGYRIEYAGIDFPCPYGFIGDRLWVKETWRGGTDTLESVWYKASDNCALNYGICQCSWEPSIFMPKEFSRITLEITNVRVERLQDISEQDALSESMDAAVKDFDITPVSQFRLTWKLIYGEKSWNENPWVWVIEFKKL